MKKELWITAKVLILIFAFIALVWTITHIPLVLACVAAIIAFAGMLAWLLDGGDN